MIVVLIGYMASGKSTIGKMLAEKLNYNFIDLDDYIEASESKSVSQIFETKGEIYFRKQETYYLKELLKSKNNIVLSFGGGTPCFGDNMDAVLNSKNTTSVYLRTSIGALVERLKIEKSKRPLIAHIETDELLIEFIGKHLFERAQYYNKANMVISTDNKAENAIVEELVASLF